MDNLDLLLSRRAMNRPELARRLGLSRSAVYHWDTVPRARVLDVARVLRVRPYSLRPDLYPDPEWRL